MAYLCTLAVSTMSSMYGYSDYNGPIGEAELSAVDETIDVQNNDDDDDPLRSGLWMEGDSLAPPCGTSVSTIHKLLSFADISCEDVLYDFGCGDGRVLLEALVQRKCPCCIGVEIEPDLVKRFHYLISRLPQDYSSYHIMAVQADLRVVLKALLTSSSACVANVSRENRQPHGAELQEGTISTFPLPTVLVLYLLPEAISELESDLLQLLRLLPRLRVVCNTWGFTTVKPIKSILVEETPGGASTVFSLYTHNSLSD